MEMDFTKETQEGEKKTEFDSKNRVKTSNRMNYEAQVEVIRKQLGGLESVRAKLNLSQRKMAQLLMVDPSAWSRWVSEGDSAPPHIYRALQWYMTLQEQVPGLNAAYFLQKDTQSLKMELAKYTEDKLTDLEMTLRTASQGYIQGLQAHLEEMKHRTDAIVHQSSKDVLKLEEEVMQLKAEVQNAEKLSKEYLKNSQKDKKRLFLIIALNVLAVSFIGIYLFL